MMEKQRIEYIDLMKGICIVLIILLHNGVNFSNETLDSMFKCFRIPLYFCLSGLFFKEYGGFGDFCIRKINKLLIPYIFFVYIPYALIDITLSYHHTISSYFFMFLEPYNLPLWFLRCLFLTYILYYIYHGLLSKRGLIIQILFVLGATFSVWFINRKLTPPNSEYLLMFYPLVQNMITAVIAIPFFFIASMLRKKGILAMEIKRKNIVMLFFLFGMMWLFTYQARVDYRTALLGNNYLFLYTSALGGIGCVWCIAYILKRLFYFSYVGRYSLIALGTHYPLILFFRWLGLENIYVIAFCVLAIMPGVIWVFKKYFPFFTAQKDLLVYDNGSIKWAWKKHS